MKPWTVRTRKKLSKALLTSITRLVRLYSAVVPYRTGIHAGAVLGLCAYYLLPRDRKRALTHLGMAFGDKDPEWIRRTARRCFIHLGKSLFEVTLMSSRRLQQVVDVEGEENLRKALSRGKGVVYVTGHIGNWEVMGHMAASISNLSVIAAPIEPEEVNEMIVNLRAGMGVKTILRGTPGASRELIRVFKENRLLGILIDQDTKVEGAFVDFFGRPAWTPTGAASMAIKFDAPVVFGYMHRGPDNRHTMTIEGPLDLIRTGDEKRDIIANTAMLIKKIEAVVARNPEQWVWMHRRWKRQPAAVKEKVSCDACITADPLS